MDDGNVAQMHSAFISINPMMDTHVGSISNVLNAAVSSAGFMSERMSGE